MPITPWEQIEGHPAFKSATDQDRMNIRRGWEQDQMRNQETQNTPQPVIRQNNKNVHVKPVDYDRGFFGDIGSNLARGAVDAASQIGGALRQVDTVADDNDGVLDRVGTSIKDWAERQQANREFLRPDQGEVSGEAGWFKQSATDLARSVGPSVIPGLVGTAAVAGAAVAAPALGLGALTGAAATAIGTGAGFGTLAATFGLGTYNDKVVEGLEQIKKRNPELTDEEAREQAHDFAFKGHAAPEVLSEVIMNASVFGKIVPKRFMKEPLKKTIAHLLGKGGAKEGLKRYAKATAIGAPFEVAGEMGASYIQTEADRELGLTDATGWEGAKRAIGPALGMQLLFGGATHGLHENHIGKLRADLNNIENPEARLDAALKVGGKIGTAFNDPGMQEAWTSAAADAISNNKPIDLDSEMVDFAAAKMGEQRFAENLGPNKAKLRHQVAEQKKTPEGVNTNELIALRNDPQKLAEAGLNPGAVDEVILEQFEGVPISKEIITTALDAGLNPSFFTGLVNSEAALDPKAAKNAPNMAPVAEGQAPITDTPVQEQAAQTEMDTFHKELTTKYDDGVLDKIDDYRMEKAVDPGTKTKPPVTEEELTQYENLYTERESSREKIGVFSEQETQDAIRQTEETLTQKYGEGIMDRVDDYRVRQAQGENVQSPIDAGEASRLETLYEQQKYAGVKEAHAMAAQGNESAEAALAPIKSWEPQDATENLSKLYEHYAGQKVDFEIDEATGAVQAVDPRSGEPVALKSEALDRSANLFDAVGQQQGLQPLDFSALDATAENTPRPVTVGNQDVNINDPQWLEEAGTKYQALIDNVNKVVGVARGRAVELIVQARSASAGMTPQQYVGLRGLELRIDAKNVNPVIKQLNKGAFSPSENKNIIDAFKKADVSTIVHELGHLFRRDLALSENTDMIEAAEKWAGVRNGKWHTAQEEKFARGFERYLAEGKAPNDELKGIFELFKDWITRIYGAIKGSPIGGEISPEMSKVFESLLTTGQAIDPRIRPKERTLKGKAEAKKSKAGPGLARKKTKKFPYGPMKVTRTKDGLRLVDKKSGEVVTQKNGDPVTGTYKELAAHQSRYNEFRHDVVAREFRETTRNKIAKAERDAGVEKTIEATPDIIALREKADKAMDKMAAERDPKQYDGKASHEMPWYVYHKKVLSGEFGLRAPSPIFAVKPQDITVETLKGFPAKEVKEMARAVGVPISGKKEAVVERIVARTDFVKEYRLESTTAEEINKQAADKGVELAETHSKQELSNILTNAGFKAPSYMKKEEMGKQIVMKATSTRDKHKSYVSARNHYTEVAKAVKSGKTVADDVLDSNPQAARMLKALDNKPVTKKNRGAPNKNSTGLEPTTPASKGSREEIGDARTATPAPITEELTQEEMDEINAETLFQDDERFPKVDNEQTRSPAFKKWFGKSMVRDGGQAVMMYHGTPDPKFLSDKSIPWIFDDARRPRQDSSELAPLGIFLGDESIAMAHSGGMDGTVHPFFVRLVNPKKSTSEQLEKVVTSSEAAKAYVKMLELNGYDGILITDRAHVIVFDNTQVKSAIDNSGDFGLDNPDTLYQSSAIFDLPNTLKVLNDKMLQGKSGKFVKRPTIEQVIKQKGVKQIEKDIVNEVLSRPEFADKKSFPYDDFKIAVQTELMPLDKIKAGTYADYGADSIGFNYDSADSIVYNSPIKHGVGDHFASSFNERGSGSREAIEYEVVQIPDRDTWIALDKNRPSTATGEELQGYVGTAGSEQTVKNWVKEYENADPTKEDAGVFGHVRRWLQGKGWFVAEVQSDFYQKHNAEAAIIEDAQENPRSETQRKLLNRYKAADEYISNAPPGLKSAEEKGGEIAKKIANTKKTLKAAEVGNYISRRQGGDEIVVGEPVSLKNTPYRFFTYKDSNAHYVIETSTGLALSTSYSKEKAIEDAQLTIESQDVEGAISKSSKIGKTVDEIREGKKKLINRQIAQYEQELIDLPKTHGEDYIKLFNARREIAKLDKEIPKHFTLEQKQFIAHKKNYTERLVREEIREASKQGAETFHLPTPHTLATIEGYIEGGGEGTYRVIHADNHDSLSIGDTIEYMGDEYIVLEADRHSIEVGLEQEVYSYDINEFAENETEYEADEVVGQLPDPLSASEVEGEYYYGVSGDRIADLVRTFITDNEIDTKGKDIDEVEIEVADIQDEVTEEVQDYLSDEDWMSRFADSYSGQTVGFSDDGETAFVLEYGGTESLSQPEYIESVDKEDFDIDDLSDEHAGIAKNYEKMGEFLKEQSPETYRIESDENGYDWYTISLDEEQGKEPVTLFQFAQPADTPLAEAKRTILNEPAFKKWFKDSKIVDENGEPLVVYHGTKRNFSAFQSNYENGLTFFTINPDFAGNWIKGTGGLRDMEPESQPYVNEIRDIEKQIASELRTPEIDDHNAPDWIEKYDAFRAEVKARVKHQTGFEGPYEFEKEADSKIHPVFLSIQNPFDPRTQYKEIEEFLLSLPRGMAEIVQRGNHKRGNWVVYENEDVVAELRRRGYDGVYLSENLEGPHDTIAAFAPQQVKSIFNSKWDGNNPNTLYQSLEGTANWEVPTEDTLLETLKYHVVDKLAPLKRVQGKMGDIPDELNVYMKEALRVSKAQHKIDLYDENHVQPILKMMKDAGVSLEKAESLLYANHAEEANERLRRINAMRFIKELIATKKGKDKKKLAEELEDLQWEQEQAGVENPETQDDYLKLLNKSFGTSDKELVLLKRWQDFSEKPSGMSDQEAQQIKADNVGNTALQDIATRIQGITDLKIDLLTDAGLLSKSEAAAWRNYESYVPLRREGYEEERLSTGAGVSGGAKPGKVRAGSTKRATNIFANIVADYQQAAIAAGKAETRASLKGLIEANPNDAFWDIRESNKDPYYDKDGNIVHYDSRRSAPNEIPIRVDGKQYIVEFKNTEAGNRIAGALKNDIYNHGPLVDGFSKVTRFLAMMNTSMSPEFMVSNFFRDAQTAAYNMSDTQLKDMKMKVMKDITKALPGINKALKGDKTSEWSKIWEDFRSNGGKVSWLSGYDTPQKNTEKLQKEIDLALKNDGKTIAKRGVKTALDTIERANTVIENAVRLSFYKHAVDAGMTKEQAALAAKELTTNFERKGAHGQLVNSFYMFANAGVQGSSRIIRALKNSKQARRMVGATIGVATLLDMFNRAMAGEDDDGENKYDAIEEHIKERNIVIMNGTDNPIKIPLPWGYNVFWMMGSELGRLMTKEGYDPLEGAARVAVGTANAFNPIQAATLLQTLSPTLLDPFVQVAENKTAFNTPLKPTQMPGKNPTPEYQQHWSSVREPSKWIAKALNDITGGNTSKPGAVDISPEVLDTFYDTVVGSAGRFVADIGNAPLKALKGDDVEIKEIPFLRRVMAGPSDYSSSKLYNQRTSEVLEISKQLKDPEISRDQKKELRQDPNYKMIARTKVADAQLRKLRKQKRRLADNEAAVERIDAQIKRIYNRYNRQYTTNLR